MGSPAKLGVGSGDDWTVAAASGSIPRPTPPKTGGPKGKGESSLR